MSTVINELAGFALQLAVFLVIPLVWHRATRKSFRGFCHWIGLRRPARRGVLLAIGCLALLAPLVVMVVLRAESLHALMLSPSTPSGRLHQMGFSAASVAVLLIAAVLKTGFCEELFFRGFAAKRLIARLGFAKGNLLQAILFMAIHVPMVLAVPAESRSIGLLSFVIVNPFMCSLLAVWLNEKQGGGSIVPGWILHAGANVTAYSVAAFWM